MPDKNLFHLQVFKPFSKTGLRLDSTEMDLKAKQNPKDKNIVY